MRKTIEVAKVLALANAAFRNSAPDRKEAREGIASLLEAVLMETGNYKGFRYLEGWPTDDETRREYYGQSS